MINIEDLIKILQTIQEQEGKLDIYQVYNEKAFPLEEKTIVLTMIDGFNVLVFT